LNKSEIIDAISTKVGGDISKKDIGTVVDTLFDTIIDTVAKGDKFTLVGFGTFEAKKKPARVGRNPANGQELKIPARTAPKFTAGTKFKSQVNK
jgi:DNA-binding protein HU-beta